MKIDESEAAARALQTLMDRSAASAGRSVARSVAYPDRQMSAAELIEFWAQTGLVAMCTVGANGQPHVAPVHARLLGTRLTLVVYDDTVRRRDLQTNPRVAFTTWGPGGAAVILYGRARELEGSLRPARDAQDGTPRNVVEIEVELTRVYAMAARAES